MEETIFHPPHLMRRYQFNKALGAAFMGVIFTGWLLIQGSNPAMRFAAVALLLLTAWFTARSIVTDIVRARGRQISIRHDTLRIVLPAPTAPHESRVHEVRLGDISHALWREDEGATLGLWLMDSNNRVLAHLDGIFLADQTEARAFLHWLRSHAHAPFEVRWPPSP